MKINELKIVKQHFAGKVRDIYDLGDNLLIVTSDRVSAFDVVFPTLIPNKGKILNQISVHFFKMTEHIVNNHLISANIEDYPKELQSFREELQDRSMLVKKTKVIPFECIVRGYISGSAWKEYKSFGTVSEQLLPEGIKESQRLLNIMFTPSTKAEAGNDENISYEEMISRLDNNIAEFLKDRSIQLYKFGRHYLLDRGIIIADTKFEFGTLDGEIILIDEILTPDSSRFWDKSEYQVGMSVKSYDKQYLRDFIVRTGWDKKPPAPELSDEVVTQTYDKYYQAYKTIVGKEAKEW